MLSDTLVNGLEHYRIGAKIKALRAGKKLSLMQLAEHTGISISLISKLERGQIFPTLPTLLRIALVFGVGLDHFFTERDDKPLMSIVRKRERIKLPDRPESIPPAYFFESLDYPVTDRKMEAYYAEFPERSQQSPAHKHAGAELIYVMSGSLAIAINDSEVKLDRGDSIYFDSASLHSYRRDGDAACTAIVVVSMADAS